jgi:hypothetical protein
MFFRRSPSIAAVEKEQDAVPDNGIAVERREAPGPTSLGQRARSGNPW